MIPIVVLAAGTGERMRAAGINLPPSGKLGLDVAGRSVLAWTLWFARGEGTPWLVMRPGQPLPDDVSVREVEQVVAEHAERGMGWSLAAGLAAVPEAAPGAIVVLADDPMTLAHLPGVREQAEQHPEQVVAVRRTPFVPHPVYLPRALWLEPGEDGDDNGMRPLLERADTVWIDDHDGSPIDLDTPADLLHLDQLLRTRIQPQ